MIKIFILPIIGFYFLVPDMGKLIEEIKKTSNKTPGTITLESTTIGWGNTTLQLPSYIQENGQLRYILISHLKHK